MEKSRPMRLRHDSNAGLALLTKEQRLAKRKASMTAGDSWADLHGTRDRPGRETVNRKAAGWKQDPKNKASDGGGVAPTAEAVAEHSRRSEERMTRRKERATAALSRGTLGRGTEGERGSGAAARGALRRPLGVRPSAGVQTRIRRSCTAASSEGAAAAAAAGGPGAAPAKKKKSVAWVEGTSDALTC